MVQECKALIDGYNYCVYYPWNDGIFILHIEKGSRKGLFKLTKELIESNDNIYFCAKDKAVWKNHSKLFGFFENNMEVYRYVRKG